MGKVYEGTVYLQIGVDNEPIYRRALRLVRAGTKKPRVRIGGTALVKLRVRIPASVFEPLEANATVDVPEDLIGEPTAEVSVGDAT